MLVLFNENLVFALILLCVVLVQRVQHDWEPGLLLRQLRRPPPLQRRRRRRLGGHRRSHTGLLQHGWRPPSPLRYSGVGRAASCKERSGNCGSVLNAAAKKGSLPKIRHWMECKMFLTCYCVSHVQRYDAIPELGSYSTAISILCFLSCYSTLTFLYFSVLDEII